MNGIYTSSGVENKNDLWKRYGHLVRQEALRLQVRLPASVELDDLIQAGSLGFLSAIDSFDPKKGVAISAYIIQRVRWALMDELRERDWVPRRVRTHAREMAAVIQRLEQQTGAAAEEKEIAREMGISLQEYHAMLHDTNLSQIYSLDELQEEFADAFEKPEAEHEQLNPLHGLLQRMMAWRGTEEIKFLPPREQLLLSLYYQQELNMREVASLLDLTETRVSQLHSQAIKRLRARLDAREAR